MARGWMTTTFAAVRAAARLLLKGCVRRLVFEYYNTPAPRVHLPTLPHYTPLRTPRCTPLRRARARAPPAAAEP